MLAFHVIDDIDFIGRMRVPPSNTIIDFILYNSTIDLILYNAILVLLDHIDL